MSDPYLDQILAEELKRTLTPVKTREVFKDHLRHNLALAGRQQVARRGRPARRQSLAWDDWWIAVALMGLSIAAGSVLAFLIRTRILTKQPA